MTTLDSVWAQQQAYNLLIRSKEQPDNFEYWMKQYLIGLLAETGDLLDEINWKLHRRSRPMDKMNVGRELADITKYVMSMWQWAGFTSQDMLLFIEEKNHELHVQYRNDFVNFPKEGQPVIITDVDGTMGDYRRAFYRWLKDKYMPDLPLDSGNHLAMEIDLKIPYSEYVGYKDEFEATGGYRLLEVYPDVRPMLDTAFSNGVYIIAYTARPAQRFSRIWQDTWAWLESQEIDKYVKGLHIGQETRISEACNLMLKNHKVLLLEDDPSIAIRAANAGVLVMLRNQPYNVGISHSNILRVDKFDEDLAPTWLWQEE